jgi:hypothetical protein
LLTLFLTTFANCESFMTIYPQVEDAALFSLWIQRSSPADPCSFQVRFEVGQGQGMLSLERHGRHTPQDSRGQVGDLSADQIRSGVFVHLIKQGRIIRNEYALWGAQDSPEALPCGAWIPLLPRGVRLVPAGWAVADVSVAEDQVTELVSSSRRLGAAMKIIKERRMNRPAQPPPGLVRHLRRTIERQKQEIDFLRGQLAERRR